jgi:type III secretion apparatus needle protein
MPISFDGLDTAMDANLTTLEGDLDTAITSLGTNPTTADLLALQRKMQEWSMLIDLKATLCKTISETMKGIIQKSG